ncbi:hypothetical protein HYX13_04515 [Candidatus Woesearchaeota archaeon]|nr:hypothetical protein [Candidatus Woesearchaeota archaeon]
MVQKKFPYAGKYAALIDEKIVATAKTSVEVYKKAKKKNPTQMITLMYLPTKKETITFL